MRAIVVEDDTGCRLLLQTVLAQRCHQVVGFSSGEEAWDACQVSAFDLGLLNWNLPEMDGIELCRKLRGLEWGQRLQVLMVTACDAGAEIERLLEAGADDVVIKPIDPGVLAVRLTVAEHRARAAWRTRGTGDAPRPQPAANPGPGITAAAAALTVLVVEDCEDTRMVLVDALKGLGYRTLVAGDGAEALELLGREEVGIGVVITDLSMPRMDGRELYVRCRRRNPRIGFLFCTGYPVDKVELGITGDERAAVVEKPVTVKALARIIDQVLEG